MWLIWHTAQAIITVNTLQKAFGHFQTQDFSCGFSSLPHTWGTCAGVREPPHLYLCRFFQGPRCVSVHQRICTLLLTPLPQASFCCLKTCLEYFKMCSLAADESSGAAENCSSRQGKAHKIYIYPTHSGKCCSVALSKAKGEDSGLVFEDVATGIVPDQLKYPITSCGGAEKEPLAFAAGAVIKPSMETAFVWCSTCIRKLYYLVFHSCKTQKPQCYPGLHYILGEAGRHILGPLR